MLQPQALGHKSTTATEIYARIGNDALRSAMEQAQAKMLDRSSTDQECCDEASECDFWEGDLELSLEFGS